MHSDSDYRARLANREQSQEERALRRYFRKVPKRPRWDEERGQLLAGGAAVVLSLILVVLSGAAVVRWFLGPVLFLIAALAVSTSLYRVLRRRHHYREELRQIFPRPGDNEVDAMLRERFERLVRHSANKLGVEPEPGVEPLQIQWKVLWYTPGIDPDDLVWRQGGDGVVRFGVYGLAVIWLTKTRLAAFSCDYDFLRDAVVNEKTDEYYYQNIVPVATRDEGSSLTLPTGESIMTVQRLVISVANNEFFVVTVGSSQLSRFTGVEQPPTTGLEKAKAAIRSKLEEKKRALEHPAAGGRAASLR
jgi:hypothetical protein